MHDNSAFHVFDFQARSPFTGRTQSDNMLINFETSIRTCQFRTKSNASRSYLIYKFIIDLFIPNLSERIRHETWEVQVVALMGSPEDRSTTKSSWNNVTPIVPPFNLRQAPCTHFRTSLRALFGVYLVVYNFPSPTPPSLIPTCPVAYERSFFSR